MMKSNPLLAALVGLLFLSAMATVVLAARHFFALVELQKLQEQSVQVNNTMAAAQSLANEAIIYAKQNPAITSVLERFKNKEQTETSVPLPVPSSALAPRMVQP